MSNLQFKTYLKTFKQEGYLAWEYNPLHNYRLNEDVVFYDGLYIPIEKFLESEYVINHKLEYAEAVGIYDKTDDKYIEKFQDILKNPNKLCIFYKKGQLVDFITDELNFDLSNPVNITPQWSYDNSVNLIINDGKNPPRLINSRFSPTKRNEYQICDRKGNNDTNIYDLGELFDIDTSLYKKMTTIPELDFMGVFYGGLLGIGNYHFYFKYIDEDGNESDFFAESGLVSIFIGNSANSIYSGFRHQNSHKQVKFILSNTDTSYNKIVVYYTKSTSDIFQNSVVQAFKIDTYFLINKQGLISITGFEPVTEITLEEINTQYLIYGAAETQASAQNMLFLANVSKPKTEYEDLADCALRFCPVLKVEKYNNNLNKDYTGTILNTYYDPTYIYNKVGYWDDEIYRFGIVFIKLDNTLTEAFNVRGIKDLTSKINYENYEHFEFTDVNDKRQFISFDEFSFKILSSGDNSNKTSEENAKGVVRINESNQNSVIGINFNVDEKVIEHLKKELKIKGFFFVRQKRIPTTLCLAFTINIDKQSNVPVLNTKKDGFITEGFLNQETGYLDHSFDNRIIKLEEYQCSNIGAICPEYDVDYPFLNTLFSGAECSCSVMNLDLQLLNRENNHFYIENENFKRESNYYSIKVIGLEDSCRLVAINDTMFSARAGEAEEGFRYAYAGTKKVDKDNRKLLRGIYGPYLGITGLKKSGLLINIKIPGFSEANIDDYFSIRYLDNSSYFAISDRIDLFKSDNLLYDKKNISIEDEQYTILEFKKDFYRGDCYICLFTHRINRNFQDPAAPTNDEIVDPKCWINNFEVTDGVVKKENFDKINLGDLNAIRMGMYITLTVRSTMNLNIRALDESLPDEVSLFGHPRGFYPYFPMTTSGAYKIPEALCYNKGFEKSVSERYNMEVPDVPWIKNEFSNRIAYSNILINDAFLNGWRTFMGTHFRDYPKTYGSITKIIELGGNLLCVFEHGIALIAVNERAIAAEGAGGLAYINTSNVLPENPKIISDKFGSLWRDSVIKTPVGIYGVDTIGKKIWKTDGNSIEYISEFRILEFLNNNITLNERELTPIIGIRNVKTHYNAFKGDVMFTFYDNLHGFSERVWNLCWNEKLQKWITFYSWVPSYSENIYNSYFSFDRNTSKWIAKLGISKSDNEFSDGVTLSNVIIEPFNHTNNDVFIGYLSLSNRLIDENSIIKYTLERDNYGNHKYFKIDTNVPKPENEKLIELYNKQLLYGLFIRSNIEANYKPTKSEIEYSDLCSEFYQRQYGEIIVEKPKESEESEELWKKHLVNDETTIYKNDKGKRMFLESEDLINPDKIVRLLNIRAYVTNSTSGNVSADEAIATGNANESTYEAGYYKSTIAVITRYNLLFLTTDFWKHGQAGIIDIADKIYPTYWYGKQHPFEFEFVVADNPDVQKIFDNLEIISNKAVPESFHYEIVGECYDFAKDKKNMYIRQEATKELYQYNGVDIEFDNSYELLDNVPRDVHTGKAYDETKCKDPNFPYYDKSTIFPQWYYRKDTINEIEDSYHMLKENTKLFDQLAGAEIVKYDNLNEYRIWNHVKGVDMRDPLYGRLRGNMEYCNDIWKIQINPINIVLKNETKSDWKNKHKSDDKPDKKLVPAELNHFNILDNLVDSDFDRNIYLPNEWERNIVKWKDYEKLNKEVKLKDKFIKIRVRYKGDDLAIISAIKTLYRISNG